MCKKQRIPWNKGLTKDTDKRVAKYSASLTSERRSIIVKKAYENLSDDGKRIRANNISKGKTGVKFSKEHCHNMSLSQMGKVAWNKNTKGVMKPNKTSFKKGKTHPRWRGGISTLNKMIRDSKEYKQWRFNVFKRDNFSCTVCNSNNNLEAHHIVTFSRIIKNNKIQSLKNALGCTELWDINNGITYCLSCHVKKDEWRNV